ncbi:MAG: hypothetical protein ABIS86_11185 [Streptosporangiaceae bacterium]
MQEMIHTDLTVTEPSSPTVRADLWLPPVGRTRGPSDGPEPASGPQARQAFRIAFAGWLVCAGTTLLARVLGVPTQAVFWVALICLMALCASVEYQSAHGHARPSG